MTPIIILWISVLLGVATNASANKDPATSAGRRIENKHDGIRGEVHSKLRKRRNEETDDSTTNYLLEVLDSEECQPFMEIVNEVYLKYLNFADDAIVQYTCNDIQRNEIVRDEVIIQSQIGPALDDITNMGYHENISCPLALDYLLSMDEEGSAIVLESTSDFDTCKEEVNQELMETHRRRQMMVTTTTTTTTTPSRDLLVWGVGLAFGRIVVRAATREGKILAKKESLRELKKEKLRLEKKLRDEIRDEAAEKTAEELNEQLKEVNGQIDILCGNTNTGWNPIKEFITGPVHQFDSFWNSLFPFQCTSGPKPTRCCNSAGRSQHNCRNYCNINEYRKSKTCQRFREEQRKMILNAAKPKPKPKPKPKRTRRYCGRGRGRRYRC